MSLDHSIDLKGLKRELNTIAKDLGLSDLRLDIEAIETSRIVISIRGSIRDPRKRMRSDMHC